MINNYHAIGISYLQKTLVIKIQKNNFKNWYLTFICKHRKLILDVKYFNLKFT